MLTDSDNITDNGYELSDNNIDYSYELPLVISQIMVTYNGYGLPWIISQIMVTDNGYELPQIISHIMVTDYLR